MKEWIIKTYMFPEGSKKVSPASQSSPDQKLGNPSPLRGYYKCSLLI